MNDSTVLPVEGAKKDLASVSYGLFQDDTFMGAVARLTAHKFKDPRTTLHVMKLSKAVSEELTCAQKCFITTLKDYAELDDSGEIKAMKDKPGTYKIKEAKVKEWQTAFNEFKSIKSSLNRKKLAFEDLDGFTVSALELDALGGLIKVEED